ncbi:MAG: group II intron reverse transcriptase/maturase [Puniceicoccaceae bacterium]|nr:MAG: group II intron reverse transcriptase/maturase [Puniceicoccaceae bacterium]
MAGTQPQGKHEAAESKLLEAILSPANLEGAWRSVKANAGAAGIDGMSVEAFPAFWQEHRERIVAQLKEGSYRPAAVRRVWIPKGNGEERPLGVPTVLDRVIQQAIAQILSLIFEGQFSAHSHGFRPGRRAQDAVKSIQEAAREGYVHAVDCDLKSFFDKVNHGELMQRLRRRIQDGRVLHLIGRYLKAGVRLPDGKTEATPEGVPQGGPLSPLLANIMLDDLDHELERRGHRFARYADDFIIVVKSKRAAERVMRSISGYIETKLKLVVNQAKTKAARLSQCSFLGFVITPKRIRCLDSKLDTFKRNIRVITSRSWGISMEERLERLRLYVNGWLGYYAMGVPYKDIRSMDQWLRRRVRLCYWKQWKLPKTRFRNLLKLGINRSTIKQASRCRKGYWRCSNLRVVCIAMNNDWLNQQGCPSIKEQWKKLCYPNG